MSTDISAARQLSPAGDIIGPVTESFLQQTVAALRASAPALASRTTSQIAARLGRTAAAWLQDDTPWLERAATDASRTTGYSPAMVRWAVSDLLRRLSASSMVALVEAELGAREPFQAPREREGQPCARSAQPPALIFQVLAGTVPPVAIEAIALALLVRGPLLLKTAREEPSVARLFLESLRANAPDIADSVAVLTWAGGEGSLDSIACGAATIVTAHGSEDTVNALLSHCRFPTRFTGYGHRLSFGVIGPADRRRGSAGLAKLAASIALDTAAYDQRGCMSPHCVFIADDAPWTADELARALVEVAFPEVESTLPRGRVAPETQAALVQALGVAEFTARLYRCDSANVVVHDGPGFRASPGGRTLHLVPYSGLAALTAALEPLQGAISTVGLDYPREARASLVTTLARLGARRITRFGRMQRPIWLRDHDGRPRLGDWVDWVNVEPLI